MRLPQLLSPYKKGKTYDNRSTICALMLAALAGATQAAAPGDRIPMDSRAIAERYAQARDNCAEEHNPGHRKQY